MSVIVGSLSGQNWHRQMRRRGLDQVARLDYMIAKTTAVAKEFGFSPMGIDLGLTALPSLDHSYLDELKARFKENDLAPAYYVGGGSLSHKCQVLTRALS